MIYHHDITVANEINKERAKGYQEATNHYVYRPEPPPLRQGFYNFMSQLQKQLAQIATTIVLCQVQRSAGVISDSKIEFPPRC